MTVEQPSSDDDAARIARLARCAADLYRTVPREGEGLTRQAAEIARAAELDALADSLEGDADQDDTEESGDDALLPADIHAVCSLLLDVRRNPGELSVAERTIARRHFPEVEAESLDPLEELIAFYTGLLEEPGHGRR